MNLAQVNDAVLRVCDDVRATAEERRFAAQLQNECATATADRQAEIVSELRRLLAFVESRSHRSADPSRPGGGAVDGLSWSKLFSQLIDIETKWGDRANRQLLLGILTFPVLVVGVVMSTFFGLPIVLASILLTGVVGAAITYSLMLFRVYEQATRVEERMAEKRVGLKFLQMAVEEYAGQPQSELMIRAGTRMFLGHGAGETSLAKTDLLSLGRTTATRRKTTPE